MKIYDFEGFPNPARVRMALAEKRALEDVTFVSVNVPEGEHRTAAFLAKNPSGTVPVLELEDGTTISECTAITEYLDHHYGPATLTGSTPKERAQIHMMQRRAETSVLDAVGAYFHHATEGLGAALETNQNPEWGQAQRQRARAGMAYFDTLLAQQEFVAGAQFSMADITLFAGLAFAEFAGIEVSEEHQHLNGWRERIAARPALAA